VRDSLVRDSGVSDSYSLVQRFSHTPMVYKSKETMAKSESTESNHLWGAGITAVFHSSSIDHPMDATTIAGNNAV
jgi:hypothetical protein